MRKNFYLFIFLLFCTVSLSYNVCFAQSGWMTVYTGTYGEIHCIDFPSRDTGYAVGKTYNNQRTIQKTINGGQNWVNISIPLAGIWWYTQFINNNTGYVAGTGGVIIKTTNGGAEWFPQSSGITNIIWALNFVNANTGYGGAEFGKIIKTTNGGANWFSQVSNSNEYIEKFYFFNANTGFACGRVGTLLKTTNGGTNWQPISMGTSLWFVDIDFVNNQTGYLAGGHFYNAINLIMKTTNGGANWVTQLNSGGFYITGITFPSINTGYACGLPGVILKTTNGGTNWLFQSIPPGDSCDHILFLDNSTGYAGGYSGRLYKTQTGGTVSINPLSSEIPKNYSLEQNFPNPFNPSTKIRFEIPHHITHVRLSVYDILGQEVVLLLNEEISPGKYEYTFDGRNLSSGMYFYKLQSEDFIDTKKMILVK